jgi:hypothetical protein
MTTTSTSRRAESPQLQPLAQRLQAWRATRPLGQRIPEELWKAAVDLARVHGLSRTATALKLSYADLQRRLSGHRVSRRGRRLSPPAFVELAAPTLPTSLRDCGTLEVVQGSEARLILRLPNARPRELLPLVQLFLRHRS